jgi:hypothetical protein
MAMLDLFKGCFVRLPLLRFLFLPAHQISSISLDTSYFYSQVFITTDFTIALSALSISSLLHSAADYKGKGKVAIFSPLVCYKKQAIHEAPDMMRKS